jgi:ethanolamine ammonia-lyase small subunit
MRTRPLACPAITIRVAVVELSRHYDEAQAAEAVLTEFDESRARNGPSRISPRSVVSQVRRDCLSRPALGGGLGEQRARLLRAQSALNSRSTTR